MGRVINIVWRLYSAIEYLNEIQDDNKTQITVIDGSSFERLIYKKKRLLKRIEEVINASSK